MIHARTSVAFGEKKHNIIVPTPACRLIARVFTKSDVVVSTDDRLLSVVGDGCSVVTKLIHAIYPAWERVIMPAGDITATVRIADLVAALDRLAAAGKQPATIVKDKKDKTPLKPLRAGVIVAWDAASSNELTLSLAHSADAEGTDTIVTSDIAGAVEIGVSPTYLGSLAAAFDNATQVRLNVHGNAGDKPLIRIDTPDGNAFGVVMPLSI